MPQAQLNPVGLGELTVMEEQLRPHYAEAFRCIGPECEDTCCQGWFVAIDQATYKKYQAIPGFQSLMAEHLVLNTRNATDSDHARVRLTPSCTCPFLAPDRLCSIQKKYGAEYLSRTCSTYPRGPSEIDGVVEEALHLSCPEAARLVLLNAHLTQPGGSLTGDRSRYHRFLLRSDQGPRSTGNPYQYLWEIRSFSLLLLQDRTLPLWQRLFILGMFCERLKETPSAQQTGFVPKLLSDYSEMIVYRETKSILDGISARPALQLEVVMRFIQRRLEGRVNSVRFLECVEDFRQGIQYHPDLPIESLVPSYTEAHTRYYEPFMREHPFILENYLINYVFKNRFPFSDSADPQGKLTDPQTAYLMMGAHYAVIRGLLIGMAGHYRAAFAAPHVVKLVQAFSKAVEHNLGFLKEIITSLKASKLGNAGGMALLLQDSPDPPPPVVP